jgi:putative FmdB family regulatory protein
MPTYDFECKKCGKVQEGFLRLSEWGNNPVCCGEKTSVKLVPVNIQPDNTCYKSMLTGEMITSRNKHRSHLKEHGCIEVGDQKQPEPKPWEMSKKERYELKNELYNKLSGLPH